MKKKPGPKTQFSERLPIMMTKKMKAELEEEAQRLELSVSHLVREAITARLKCLWEV